MSESLSPALQEAYSRGVEALLEDRLKDALLELAAPADAGHSGAVLALAKAHLRRGQGSEARRRLAPLLQEPPSDVGLHAYLLLLSASAAALEKKADEALRLLEDVPRLDPRMEHAARSLRRRLDKGRPPEIRF